MKTTHITAIFNPQPGKQMPTKLDDLKGQRFQFSEASPQNGVRMFYADDKNFPHSLLCSEYDLKEIVEDDTKIQ